jgi:hypothetical protein
MHLVPDSTVLIENKTVQMQECRETISFPGTNERYSFKVNGNKREFSQGELKEYLDDKIDKIVLLEVKMNHGYARIFRNVENISVSNKITLL